MLYCEAGSRFPILSINPAWNPLGFTPRTRGGLARQTAHLVAFQVHPTHAWRVGAAASNRCTARRSPHARVEGW